MPYKASVRCCGEKDIISQPGLRLVLEGSQSLDGEIDHERLNRLLGCREVGFVLSVKYYNINWLL